jgi:hypothetical protein
VIDDLVAWLRTQLDADEARADAALHPPPGYYDKSPLADTLREMAMQALDEVEAKRKIVEMHRGSRGREDGLHECPRLDVDPDDGERTQRTGFASPCPTMLVLTSVYAGRPGWRPEWAVES